MWEMPAELWSEHLKGSNYFNIVGLGGDLLPPLPGCRYSVSMLVAVCMLFHILQDSSLNRRCHVDFKTPSTWTVLRWVREIIFGLPDILWYLIRIYSQLGIFICNWFRLHFDYRFSLYSFETWGVYVWMAPKKEWVFKCIKVKVK